MNLVKAIDAAVEFVREHENLMTREERNVFAGLAETVFVLASKADLSHALPKIVEQQVEFADMCRAHYATKLNLPGDWEDVPPLDDDGLASPAFLVCAPPRWFEDMNALRRLAAIAPYRP